MGFAYAKEYIEKYVYVYFILNSYRNKFLTIFGTMFQKPIL